MMLKSQKSNFIRLNWFNPYQESGRNRWRSVKSSKMDMNNASTHEQTQVMRSQGEQAHLSPTHVSIQSPGAMSLTATWQPNNKWQTKFVDMTTRHLSFANTLIADQEPWCTQDRKWEVTVPMPRMCHGWHWGIRNTQISECPMMPCCHPPPSLTPCLQISNHSTSRTANERPWCPCHVHGASETPLTECPLSLLPSLPLR